MIASTALDFSAAIENTLASPKGGIVGLVDDLLTTCREHNLELDWRPGRYRVRVVGGTWKELTNLPKGRPIFRTILARLAVLCNERKPDSVSPYGGHGELSIGVDPPTIFRLAFANTLAEQHLELTTAVESRWRESMLISPDPRKFESEAKEPRAAPNAG